MTDDTELLRRLTVAVLSQDPEDWDGESLGLLDRLRERFGLDCYGNPKGTTYPSVVVCVVGSAAVPPEGVVMLRQCAECGETGSHRSGCSQA